VTVPLPPADIAKRKPRVLTLPANTVIHRFYSAGFDPIYFDRTQDGRFNAPNAEYGVCYTSRDVRGAFAEAFLRRPGLVALGADFLASKAYVRLKTNQPLVLVELTGPGLAVPGATAEVSHAGPPYHESLRWSKALYDHPSAPDGIAYMARHDDQELSYAIFDRDPAVLSEVDRRMGLNDTWFLKVALIYGVGIV
jgi:hypothetical protein